MSVVHLSNSELSGWRLLILDTRQLWIHVEEDLEDLPLFTPEQKQQIHTLFQREQTWLERFHLRPPVARAETTGRNGGGGGESLEARASASVSRVIDFYLALQAEDGQFPCDHPGLEFLMPGLVFTWYLSQRLPATCVREQIVAKILNTQLPSGGWGMTEHNCKPLLLTTTLNYVALRFLGCDPCGEHLQKARLTLLSLGGAVRCPTWVKVLLAALGLYEGRGIRSMCPELWLLPRWLPAHPARYGCYLRVLMAPMSYILALLRGRAASEVQDPLILSIRGEIYSEPYEQIDWEGHKLDVCENDLVAPPGWLMKLLYKLLDAWEYLCPTWVRHRALDHLSRLIHAEDVHSNYTQRNGVAKSMAMLATFYHSGPGSEDFQRHLHSCRDYLWPSAMGVRMKACNGMQVWDVAYSVQSICAAVSGRALDYRVRQSLLKCFDYLVLSQVIEDKSSTNPYNLRQREVGAFPYAGTDHASIVSDCTGESLVALLQLMQLHCVRESQEPDLHWRVLRAVDATLAFQCADGGCGAFEARRGGVWLEHMNPAEVFRGGVVEMSHVECTHSCLNALILFQNTYPGGMGYRKTDIDAFVRRALKFIRKKQRPDGGWVGNWGVNFTYAAAYCLRSYAATGQGYLDKCPVPKAVEKGCNFLLKHQNGDGGWSEDLHSYTEHKYSYGCRSSICHTSWALIGLMSVRHPKVNAVKRGIEFLLSCQIENGEFPEGLIKPDYTPAKEHEGVVHGCSNNGVIAVTFPNYRHYYPLMVLGMFLNEYMPAYNLPRN